LFGLKGGDGGGVGGGGGSIGPRGSYCKRVIYLDNKLIGDVGSRTAGLTLARAKWVGVG